MRTRLSLFYILIILLTLKASANDSLFRPRPGIMIGVRTVLETSGPVNIVPCTYPVFSGGLQVIKPINFWLLQFETGLYLYSRAISDDNETYHSYILLRYLSIPFNCRLNTKYVYVSVGPNADYLVRENAEHCKNWDIEINKLLLGINSNAGLQLTIKNKLTVFVEGRFSRSLISPPESFAQDYGFRNLGIGAGLYYSIGQNIQKVGACR